ncbi:MAG: hypothetical protein JHC88_13575 [Niveispirillum sp.]|nr:hypothetical protein [Niveispirillum sp.]
MLMLLLCAGPTPAQNSAQGTITLRGSVPATCAVSLSTENVSLNLSSAAIVPVATVEERCNAANGYTVSLSSKNGGALSSGTSSIAYTLHYGDSSSTADGSLTAGRPVSGAARQTVLSVSVPTATQRQAGDYQDTVTIAIAAK